MEALLVSQVSVPFSKAATKARTPKGTFCRSASRCSLLQHPATGILGPKLTSGNSPALSSRSSTRQTHFSRLVVRSQSDSQQSEPDKEKTPFGYTRKDVIIIGVALTAVGYGIRYGLEYIFGLDPLQAGNVTQLTVVIGLCLGWVSTYLWRVGNKEMTYAKQLRDYENAVMQKRLEAMSETDLEAMLAEVEEEKQRLREKRAKMAAKE